MGVSISSFLNTRFRFYFINESVSAIKPEYSSKHAMKEKSRVASKINVHDRDHLTPRIIQSIRVIMKTFGLLEVLYNWQFKLANFAI